MVNRADSGRNDVVSLPESTGLLWETLWITQNLVCSVSILPKKIANAPVRAIRKLLQPPQNMGKIMFVAKNAFFSKKGVAGMRH